VRIYDFANMTRLGERNSGATAPFYISDIAGPASEQFALGSCIFAIFKGHKPLYELDYNEQYEALEKGDFPLTDSMMFGCIISDCWHAGFDTLD
jgi:hypothetical protein